MAQTIPNTRTDQTENYSAYQKLMTKVLHARREIDAHEIMLLCSLMFGGFGNAIKMLNDCSLEAQILFWQSSAC
jgi:hypothetical protein